MSNCYKNLFSSSTSLNTVVDDTACEGGVVPNSSRGVSDELCHG